jgi:Tfp pilus assembly protein PilN
MQTPPPNAPPPGYIPASNVPEWVPSFLAAVLLICIGAWLLMPLIRAWAKRLEGRGADSALAAEISRLHDRVAELELSAARTQEIEERLDFAERLLSQRNDLSQLPLHRTPV